MSEMTTFEIVATQIERRSELNRLQARGVVRLALKEAGLNTTDVTRAQLQIVVAKRLAPHLQRNGLSAERAQDLCIAIGRVLEALPEDAVRSEAPESLFDRLDGGRRS